MLNVALTGNIAAGKSTVVDLLRRWGATIIDADELARQAQTPGGEVLAARAPARDARPLERRGGPDDRLTDAGRAQAGPEPLHDRQRPLPENPRAEGAESVRGAAPPGRGGRTRPTGQHAAARRSRIGRQ